MNTISEMLADQVSTLRTQRGISQATLAEMSKTSLNTIKSIEKGHANPSMSTLAQIAEALGVEPADLLRANEKDAEKAYQYCVANSMYPPPLPYSGKIYYMLALIIYLPLFSQTTLSDIYYRIGGNLIFDESYVVSLFSRAVERIPDSPAKRYADKVLQKMNEIQKELAAGAEIDEALQNFTSSDIPAELEDYIQLLTRNQERAKALEYMFRVYLDNHQ